MRMTAIALASGPLDLAYIVSLSRPGLLSEWLSIVVKTFSSSIIT